MYRNNDDNLVAAVKVTRSDREGIYEETVPWSYTTAGPQLIEEKEEETEKEKEDIGMHVSCMPIDLLQHSKVYLLFLPHLSSYLIVLLCILFFEYFFILFSEMG